MRRSTSGLGPASSRRGISLLELVVTLSMSSILLLGMMSTLAFTSQAWRKDVGAREIDNAGRLMSRINNDIQQALYFTERTATAITIVVPDRDGDGKRDSVRYAWAGTAGNPLTISVNGATVETLLAGISSLSFTTTTRSVTAAPLGSSSTSGRILMLSAGTVSGGNITPTSQEALKKALLESWGFQVVLADDGLSDAALATAMLDADVLYITGEAVPVASESTLLAMTRGVVSELVDLTQKLGFSDNYAWDSGNSVRLNTAFHHITQSMPVTPTSVTVVSQSEPIQFLKGKYSPDINILGSSVPKPLEVTLASLEAGAEHVNGGIVQGRRVTMPWGTRGFDIRSLTTEGQTLLRRSFDWAAGGGQDTTEFSVLMIVADSRQFTDTEHERRLLFGRRGAAVRAVSSSASDSAIHNRMTAAKATYIGSSVGTSSLQGRIEGRPNPIVFEIGSWLPLFGFGNFSGSHNCLSFTTISTSHAIGAAAGMTSAQVFTTTQSLPQLTAPVATGLVTVARNGTQPVLSALEKGAASTYSVAPARRAWISLQGRRGNEMTVAGETLLWETLRWAALQP